MQNLHADHIVSSIIYSLSASPRDHVSLIILGSSRVNSDIGKFGHVFANSGNPDETAPYEPSHQDFHCLLS